MAESGFRADFQPLVRERPAWGEVALLPWDCDLFGFAVAEYRVGKWEAVAEQSGAIRAALDTWAAARGVQLICCRVPADHSGLLFLLPAWSFTFIDFDLQAMLPRLQRATLPVIKIPVRGAAPDDGPALARIAETAFRFGRYFADPLFPPPLASRRYGAWLHNALAGTNAGEQVYVIGGLGRVTGFLHVVIKDSVADLRLGAVDLSHQSGIAGFNLYAGVLHALKGQGAGRVVARLSAANTAVMNIFADLGFRFFRAEATFHWHAPGAVHLLPPSGLQGLREPG